MAIQQHPAGYEPGGHYDEYGTYYEPEEDYADAGVYFINEHPSSYMLETAINGQYFPLVLDTGSPITLITQDHQMKLGLKVNAQERVMGMDYRYGLQIMGMDYR